MKIKWGHGMTNHIVQRIVKNMPHYYSHKNTEKFGNISVVPTEWYRKYFKYGDFSFWPYKSNDVIKFKLILEKLNYEKSPNQIYFQVWEKMGDGSWEKITDIRQNILDVEGKAGYTGDTKFFLITNKPPFRPDRGDRIEGFEIFYEDIKSLNTYIFGWGGIIVSVILTGICSLGIGILLWLLGFISLIPAWEFWIKK